MTVTRTSTALPTGTATATPTIALDSGHLTLDNILIYPNPYRPRAGDLWLSFDSAGLLNKISVRIYTASYRRIIDVTEEGDFYGRPAVSVPSRKLERLANGTYYVVLAGEGAGSGRITSKPAELIILK
jgi:hypothetical protein